MVDFEKAKEEFWRARQGGPFPEHWRGEFDMETGYRICLALIENHAANGEQGHTLSLACPPELRRRTKSSTEKLRALKIDIPSPGHLLGLMARSVDDIILAGRVSSDGIDEPLPAPVADKSVSAPPGTFFFDDLQESIKDQIDRILADLAEAGVTIVNRDVADVGAADRR